MKNTRKNNTPILTIITINKNNGTGLKKTIDSVVSQKNFNIEELEYIIIDGNSNDKSIDIINEYLNDDVYCKYISYWISEPDTGIYNAMNKGIKKAKGVFCLFLNSGDLLIENTLGKILKILKGNNNIDIFYSDIPETEEHKGFSYPEKLNYTWFIEQSIYHQGAFIRTKLFDKIGMYSENYKIVSDWEFFIKALKHRAKFKHLSFNTTYFDWNGLSNNKKFRALHNYERNDVIKNIIGNKKLFLIRTMRFMRRKPIMIIEKIKRKIKYRYRKSIDKYFINLCYGLNIKKSTYRKLNNVQQKIIDYIVNDEFYKKSITENKDRSSYIKNYLSKNKKETISVVIPHYNHQLHITKTIDSILKQTVQPDEIIIVDDMSDNIELTKKTFEQFSGNNKIKVINSDKKLYAAGARNLGASISTSDIIQFFDADDIMHPQRLEIIKQTFNMYDDISAVMTGNIKFDKENIFFPNYELDKIKENIIRPEEIIKDFSRKYFTRTKLSFLDSKNEIPGYAWGTIGIKSRYLPTLGHLAILSCIKNILQYHLPPKQIFTPCEDYEYCVLIQILTLGEYQIDLPLSYYRTGTSTCSPQNNHNIKSTNKT